MTHSLCTLSRVHFKHRISAAMLKALVLIKVSYFDFPVVLSYLRELVELFI